MANKAYTYEDFVKEAQKIGGVAQEDYALAMKNPYAGKSILTAKSKYKAAVTPEERAAANKEAERIRSEYGGYTMGDNGAKFMLNSPSPINYTEEKAPEFSYDMKTDPVYQAYAKQYAREGQRASADALGAAAAATGGIPSSYAVTAASQAGNYYASQMGDMVPKLYEQAYNRYLSELEQFNTDRDFRYGQFIDEIDSQAAKRQEEWALAQKAAEYGDYSRLEDLGVDTERYGQDAQNALAYDIAALAAQYGDYSKLSEYFGINADPGKVNGDILYKLAALRAKQGDYSYLASLLSKYYPAGA